MEIKQDPKNFRKHNKRNKEVIERSLKQCGAGRSILLDNEGGIIAGNGVYGQAEKMGLPVRTIETDGSEIIAVVRTDVGPEDQKRRDLAVFDNAAADLSTWDYSRLTEELSREELENFDVEIPNFKIGSIFENTEEIEVPVLFPIEVMANEEDYARFNALKEKLGLKKDIELVRFLMEKSK